MTFFLVKGNNCNKMNVLRDSKVLAVLALYFSLPAWPILAGVSTIPNFHQVNEHVYRGGQPAPKLGRVLPNSVSRRSSICAATTSTRRWRKLGQ